MNMLFLCMITYVAFFSVTVVRFITLLKCNVINPYFSQFCVIIKLHHLPMLSFKICHECFPAWSTSHFYLLQYLPQCKCHAFFSLQVIFLKGCKVYRVNNKQRYICQLTETFIFKYFDAICSFSHVQ